VELGTEVEVVFGGVREGIGEILKGGFEYFWW
jgi:hypothetical protein